MPFVVVSIEVVLVVSGWLGAAQATVILIVLEVILAAVVGTTRLTMRRSFKRRRSGGTDVWGAARGSPHNVLPPPLATMVGHELGMFRALWLALRRRCDVPPGGTALRYGRDLRPLLAAIAGVSVLEVIVVGGIVGALVPVAFVPWALLVISVYGFLWLISFRAALGVLPHVAGPTSLRLRFATFFDIELRSI